MAGAAMRNVAVFGGIAVAVVLALGLCLGRAQTKPTAPMTASSPSAYIGLRNLAFQVSRDKLGLHPTSKPTEPWGAVVDWGITKGTATVVAFSDGHASIYLSSGGGFLGGADSHEAIRTAGKEMVAVAAECQPSSKGTSTYPLPKQGEVNFYFLTDAGTYLTTVSEETLRSRSSPLSKLFDAVQKVIAEYRHIQ